ncbi:MAG: type II toxin-antitoxin system VapC family toxin [Alphaproteobacteria bacterium]|nr:type II toxin-antitoxin system VapC family toxin [Alphaproteobacteria bacterium]
MTAIVLDAFVTLAALCHDEFNHDCMAIVEQAIASGAAVPPLWAVEVCNILEVKPRQEKLAASEVTEIQAILSAYESWIESGSPLNNAIAAAVLARKHNLTVYSASYLEPALRLKLPLATLDTRLAHAARQAGIVTLPIDG